MKTNKLSSTSFFSNLKLYKDIYEAGSMVKLSDEKHLKLVLRVIGMRFSFLSFLRTKDTNRLRSLHNFAMFLIKLRKHHGDMYVIKFLKATQLAIQKKIAGSPFSSLREIEPDLPLPRLTKSGLPLIIKLSDRSSIVRGSLTVIRYWLSLSSLYRVLEGPIKSNLNTITDPFTGDLNVIHDFQKFLWLNSKRLLTSFVEHFDARKLEARRILCIQKASPSSKVSWNGLFNDLINLNLWLREPIIKYIQLTNSAKLGDLLDRAEAIIKNEPTLDYVPFHGKENGVHLGQLAFKEEAAGKLRVFAMVDVFTQSLLQPLHLWLFSLFKKLPNDGTHDQERAFDLANELANKYNGSFGFDLSSATDRLPVKIQSYFLSVIFGEGFGESWQSILVSRPYVILKNDYNLPVGNVYYSVGQPMGALSSWAMLNMIHHLMVQYCYCQCYGYNKSWYKDYVILGDDLVIFDPKVAEKYLALCKGLGVEINLSKSVIAKGRKVVEFAKRTGLDGKDVSALSFKDFISNNNFFGRLSISSRLVRRNWGKDNFKLFVLGNKSNKMKTRLSYPIIGYLAQLVEKGKMTYEQILSLLLDSNKPLSYFGRKLESFDQGKTLKMFKSYLRGSGLFTIDMSNLWFASRKSIDYKIYLIKEIIKLKARLEREDKIHERFDAIQLEFHPQSDLEKFYNSYPFKKDIGMDLKNPLQKRYYYKHLQAFVLRDNGIHGIDPVLGKLFLEGVMEGYLLKLLDFSNKVRFYPFPTFIGSKHFERLSIDDLKEQLTVGQSLLEMISFDIRKSDRRNKINNSLKILEFMRNTKSSQHEVKKNPLMGLPKNMFPMFLLKK
jgi:hypothetical protein